MVEVSAFICPNPLLLAESDSCLGPEFQKLDLGVSSCYEIGRRVFTGAQALYVSQVDDIRSLSKDTAYAILEFF
jgi:hypothetical protein